MSKKIFVGNLSFNTTESDLDAFFRQVGAVESVSIITDRMTGRSKGFAFVEMSDEDADAAITRLNGADLGGRNLTVNEARPPAKRDFGGGGGGGGVVVAATGVAAAAGAIDARAYSPGYDSFLNVSMKWRACGDSGRPFSFTIP